MAVLDTIVLVGLMLQNPAALEPQGTPSTSAEPRDPALDRIRSRLEQPPVGAEPLGTPLFAPRASDKPVFQVHIESPHMPPWDWGDSGTTIPAYIRPTVPPTHHEFLMAVTPEVFRAPVVHPVGVPVLSIGRAIASAIRAKQRERKEAAARREVEEALAAFKASTAKPPEVSSEKR